MSSKQSISRVADNPPHDMEDEQRLSDAEKITALRAEVRDLKLYQYELEAQVHEMMDVQRTHEHQTHYLKNIINTLPVGFVVLENQERIKQINNVAGNYLSVNPDHAVGMSIFSVLKSSELVRSFIKWLTIGVSPLTVSIGDKLHRLVTFEKAQISAQETLIICFDRTAEHKKISSINANCNTAQQKIKQLEHFIKHCLSDLKLPSEAAHNFFNLIHNNTSDNQIKGLAKRGQNHTQQLSSTVEAILEYSYLTTHGLDLKSTPIDVSRLIEKSMNQYFDIAQQRNIEFSLDTKLSSVNFMADRDKLNFIISQFVELALKTTSEGQQISVEVTQAFTEDFEKRTINFTINDTGCGFSSEQQIALFDPFISTTITVLSQADRFDLARAKGIVELFTGTVECSSEVGKGSQISIQIPLRVCDSVAPYRHTSQQKIPQLFAKVIYIIDDNPVNLDMLEELLFPTGARIERFRSAQRALSAYEFFKPDLVIADIIMPDIDGSTFIRHLRNRGYTQPAIACTVENHPEQIRSMQDNGYDCVLNKPLNVEQLYLLIDELVEQI